MSGLKDVKFLIPQSADEFIEQAPGQYDAMKKAVREATMDNHDEPMSVDDFVRSHSQLFILIKSAVREVLHEDAPAVQAQGRGHARSQICSKLMGHPGVQYAVTSFPESASLPLKTTPPCVLVDVVSFWEIACVSASSNGPISSSLKRIFHCAM